MASKKKGKKRKYIAKIISDGKISKKEAKKAVKKGISLGRIENAQLKSYKEGSRYYVEPTIKGGRGPAQIGGEVQKRTYMPLQIKGKVRSIFDTPAQTDATTGTDATDTDVTDTSQADTDVKPEVNPLQGDLDTALSEIKSLKTQLNTRPEMPDFAALFKGLADREAEARERNLIAQREQQAAYMEEMAARQMAMDRQRKLDFQTSQANTARAGMLPNFMIGGRRSGMYGTGGFKRRRRFMPATIAQGIGSLMTGGAAAANAINV